MATYYGYDKYAEQAANSSVDWSKVGKTISDTLTAENKYREDKKAEIDKSFNDDLNILQNPLQGQYQDGNAFINDFAHSMMEQQMIDHKLLKQGQMSLKDYTLRRQNYKTGTNTLFELQKLYQDTYKSRMEGLQTGELQPLSGWNMSSVEGFADFAKSKAVINPLTGVVNVSKLAPNADGIMQLTGDTMTVGEAKGRIMAPIAAWKADAVMDNTIKSLGKSVNFIYDAATKTKEGSIVKLLGLGALESEAKNHPELRPQIDAANKAIDNTIDSYFSNPYTITSVLTVNTGKYNAQSFTVDSKLAEKDPTKILLKTNPSTGLPEIDKTAPHYKDQEKEARDWVRASLLSRLDNEKTMTSTGTTPYGPQMQGWQYDAAQQAQKDKYVAGKLGDLYSGSPAAVQASLSFFKGLNPSIQDISRTKDAVVVTMVDQFGQNVQQPIRFKSADGSQVMTRDQFIQSASPLLSGTINRSVGVGGGEFNPNATGSINASSANKQTNKNPFQLTPQGYTPSATNPIGVGSKYNNPSGK